MSQDTKNLQDDIDALNLEVKLKKQLLTNAIKKEKKNRLFSETAVGGVMFKAARFLTKGVANLHDRIDRCINDPAGFQSKKLQIKSSKLLEKAAKISCKENERSSSKLALAIAKHVCEVEDFVNRHDSWAQDHDKLNDLCAEVERLRPPVDEKKLQDLKKHFETLENAASL